MRKMKDSGIEWIGQIPKNWITKRIKTIFSERTELSDSGEEELLSVSEYYGVAPRASKIDDGEYLTRSESLIGYKKCYVDDFVSNIMLAWKGSFGVTKYDGIVSPAYCVYKPISNINPWYYHYLFRTSLYTTRFKLFSKGIIDSRLRLYSPFFYDIEAIVPPREEQDSIATYLDTKCSEIDTIVRETEKTIEEYKKLKQSLITEVVTGKKRVADDGLSLSDEPREMTDSGVEWIGEVPRGWEILKIKWLLSERNERSVSGEEEPLSMSQKYGVIPTKQMDMIPNMASTFEGAKLVYVGDLVFNKLKAHLGVFSTSQYEGLVSPDYAVYFGTGKADVTYLEYLFKTPQCIFEFKKFITGVGAGLSRLYTSDLFSIYCPVPSQQEQIRIKKYLLTKCSEIDKLISDKQRLLEELEIYKKSLIYECVTGKREIN